ncbi:M3 family metallopeptidase [Bacteroidota bacterium]
MKKYLIINLMLIVLFASCSTTEKRELDKNNPFFSEFKTTFKVPPFEQIKLEHYMPAYKEAMLQQNEEIDKIVNSKRKAKFKNTIEALDDSGVLLSEVSSIFDNMTSQNTSDELQELAKELAPLLSKHFDDINLNPKLFERVKAVYEERDKLNLNTEQETLLKEYYTDFVRGGANLNEEEQARFRKINGELSVLTIEYGDNILKQDNNYMMVIDKKNDLVGLPEAVIIGAAETASSKELDGKWVFTLQKTSFIPFLQYSENRALREKVYKAFINRGNNDDEIDNKANAAKIANLRVERAKLLGYATHADFVLEKNMAKEPANVYKLLNQLWKPALRVAKNELKEMQTIINAEDGNFKLQAWDWWYYAEKLKKAKYDLDDEQIRPYLKMENVLDGAFMVANKLYGLKFIERVDLPKYHEDVRVFEVLEADNSHLAVLYTDFYPRAGTKGAGAWMSSYRKQSKIGGKDVYPVITINGNFSKPTGDKPSLMTFGEVSTLFHEFGHGLHGMLSDCRYSSLSGTSVPRDFVELPSQIMEHWAGEPEVLKMYAKHYETGEVIPDELIEKLKNAGHFNQGFITTEFLAASFLDMNWHTLEDTVEINTADFEKESLSAINLIPEIAARYRSTYFTHIFSGGYSSGYYSYIWAEVLDSDAFMAFKETDLFDKDKALSFRKNILEKGGTEDPMTLFIRFRGAEPKIDALLENRGLK